jgi:hypothetical protein
VQHKKNNENLPQHNSRETKGLVKKTADCVGKQKETGLREPTATAGALPSPAVQ